MDMIAPLAAYFREMWRHVSNVPNGPTRFQRVATFVRRNKKDFRSAYENSLGDRIALPLK
jgi:hypothetical protein